MDEATAKKVLSPFADNASIGDWAVKSVAIIIQKEIAHGFTDKTIKPKKHITRAEAAKMIHNMLHKTNMTD